MTDTIDPTIGAAQPHTQDTGTLMHVDPHALVLEINVRDQAGLDKQFLASIAEHGVLIPIAAVQDHAGTLWVRAGQRRTLAAREARLPTVPVYVRTSTVGDDAEQLVQRVTEQIVENDQRRELSDAQRARGIQQMIDAGASITKVAKKLSVTKDTVKAAAAVGKSETAMQHLAEGQLSLEEAAVLTEFEGMPAAISRLIDAAGSRRFEHILAQLREQKISAEAEAKAAQAYIEQGFTWLEEQPRNLDPDCIPLYRLNDAEGNEATEAAVSDPAHWGVVLFESEAVVDVDTGAVVDEDDVDWATQEDPEAQPAEGLRHARTVTKATVFRPQYFCLDYRAAGLTPDSWFARAAGMVDSGQADCTNLDNDDEARQAAQRQAEVERAEAEKRERRKVLALNKLGATAQSVRRDFVKKLLARKSAPKGAAIFVADTLARDSYLLSGHNAPETIAELLDLPGAEAVSKAPSALPATGDARAQVITLALILGALEARTPKDAWRNTSLNQFARHVTSADYLRWLAANGYTLAPVEEVVTGDQNADEVYAAYLAEAEKR
ncbi:ParB/RepB/Spo0J family partition protein [Mycobacterium asiaticum]|uniref:Nuclease n=1 Tax=Mycobacterium asiaticum TaxID=1790 RepID=A0A1A3KYN4_MYCAS|nr:ParB/RepB/Spo0J family partition protein [Mycobacterium asiaticum]OBJ90337.1 nuclease [Mycobacterium asiaticum]